MKIKYNTFVSAWKSLEHVVQRERLFASMMIRLWIFHATCFRWQNFKCFPRQMAHNFLQNFSPEPDMKRIDSLGEWSGMDLNGQIFT